MKKYIKLFSCLAVMAFTTVSLSGCGESTNIEDLKISLSGEKPSITIPSSGFTTDKLQVKIIAAGNGKTVQQTDSVTCDYIGWLTDGKQFDTSYGKQPATFGLNQVIKGWAQGLAGQKVGSTVLLTIPPDLAYGEKGTSSVPGNAVLIFVVHIIS